MKSTIQIAVSHAVLVFNSGRRTNASAMERLGIVAGSLCISHLASQDTYRIMRVQTRESDVAKRSRKSKQVMEKHVEAVMQKQRELLMKLVDLNKKQTKPLKIIFKAKYRTYALYHDLVYPIHISAYISKRVFMIHNAA